jgi:hypothetical protein
MAEKKSAQLNLRTTPSELKEMRRIAKERDVDLSPLVIEGVLDVPNVPERWNLMARILMPLLDLLDKLELVDDSELTPDNIRKGAEIARGRLPKEMTLPLAIYGCLRADLRVIEALEDLGELTEDRPFDRKSPAYENKIEKTLAYQLYRAYAPPKKENTDNAES